MGAFTAPWCSTSLRMWGKDCHNDTPLATKMQPRQSCMLIGILQFLAWCWIARDTTALVGLFKDNFTLSSFWWFGHKSYGPPRSSSFESYYSCLCCCDRTVDYRFSWHNLRFVSLRDLATELAGRRVWTSVDFLMPDAQIETVGKFAGNDPFLGNTFLGNEVKWLTSCHWTTEHFFQRQYCPGTVLSAARSAIRSRAGFDFEDFWLQRWALWISIFSSIVFIYLYLILLHKGPWGHRSCQQILHACSAPYLQQEAV